MANFASRLTELRKERGLTQIEFAEKMGVARSSMSGYEKNGKKPPLELFMKFADYFDVSVDYLIGHTNYRKPQYETNTMVHSKELQKRIDALGDDARSIVLTAFDSLYVMISKDLECDTPLQRLKLYDQLFSTLQSGRSTVKESVSQAVSSGSPVDMITALSDQQELSLNVSTVLSAFFASDLSKLAPRKEA